MNIRLLFKILKSFVPKEEIDVEDLKNIDSPEKRLLLQKYIFKNDFRLDDIKRWIFNYNGFNTLFYNEEIKEFFSKVSSKKISRFLNTYVFKSASYFLIINNLEKDKLINVLDNNPEFIAYYTGIDPDILIRYCDLISFKDNIFNPTILYDGRVFEYYVKNRSEILLHLDIPDDDYYINYIIKYLRESPDKISDYTGNNPKIIKFIMELIENDYRNLMYIPSVNKVYLTDEFTNFVCDILKKNPEGVSYFLINNSKVIEYIMSNNLTFSYDNIPYNPSLPYREQVRYSPEDFKYVMYLINKDIRFINCFSHITPELYNYIFNYIKKDINNLALLSNRTVSNLINYPNSEVFNYIFNYLKNDFSSVKVILPYIHTYYTVEDYIKNIINKNVEILIDYPEFLSFMYGCYDHFFARKSLVHKIKKSKKSKEIMNSLIKINPYFLEYLGIEHQERNEYLLNTLFSTDEAFLFILKRDLNNIKYYNGRSSSIYKYYFENGGELTQEVIERAAIDYDLFIKIKDRFRDYLISKYDVLDDVEDILSCFEFITKNNDETFINFNFNLLSKNNIILLKNIKTNKLNIELIRKLSRDRYAFDNIYYCFNTLDEKKKKIFAYLLSHISKSNFNIDQLLFDLVNIINMPRFKEILSVVDDVDKLNDEQLLNNIIYYLLDSSSASYFKITSLDDLINIDKKFENKMLHSNNDNNLELDKIYFLFTYFGISVKQAEHLVSRYGTKLDNFDFELTSEEIELINILKNIKAVLDCSTIEELENIDISWPSYKIDSCFYYLTEEKLRKMYARRMNDDLMKITTKSKKQTVDDTDVYFAFDEEKPKEFKILLTSLGAYSLDVSIGNYYNSWYRSKESSHAICSSLISNQMLGTAPIIDCCLGFSEVPEDSILLEAPYDIYSKTDQKNIINQHHGRKCQFLFPNDMINSSRRMYNELVIERTTDDGKIAPSYVVFFCHDFNIAKKTRKFNKFWRHAVKAANDLNIPIVVVEYSKIRKYEFSQIDELRDKILDKSTYKFNMIVDYITRLMNNCTCSHLLYAYNFTIVTSRVNELFRFIYELIDNNLIDEASMYFEDFENAIKRESALKSNYMFNGLSRLIEPDMLQIKYKLDSVNAASKKGI